jgi:hypothetical protein
MKAIASGTTPIGAIMAQTDNTRPEYIRVAEANFPLYETLTERICNTTASELQSLLEQGVLTSKDVDFIRGLGEPNKHTIYRVCKYMHTQNMYTHKRPLKRFEVAFSVTLRKSNWIPRSHKERGGYLNPKAQKKEQNRRHRQVVSQREIAAQLAQMHDDESLSAGEYWLLHWICDEVDVQDDNRCDDEYDVQDDNRFDDEYDDARYDGDCLNDPFYGDPFYDDSFSNEYSAGMSYI